METLPLVNAGLSCCADSNAWNDAHHPHTADTQKVLVILFRGFVVLMHVATLREEFSG
jgi:hypothetical protein